MQRHPWRRLLAWLIDWTCVLVWAAVIAAIGVPLYLSGATHGIGPVELNVIGGLLLIVPVTVTLAALEASSANATLGKRMLGLRVRDGSGGSMSFGRALARNSLKIALPWTLGHLAAIAIFFSSGADGDVPAYSTFVVDHWVAVPNTQHVALLSFSTTFPYERERMLELFAVIVASLRWDTES